MKSKQIDMKKFYQLQNPSTQLQEKDKNATRNENKDILDEELSKKIYQNFYDDVQFGKQFNLNNQQNLKSSQPEQKKIIKEKQYDSDEISNLAGKLTNLELLCENQREELKEQDNIIASLTEQLDTYKELLSPDQIGYKEKLQEENSKIEKEINEICLFLKEYGLRWVGNNLNKEQTKEEKEVQQLRNQFEISEHIHQDKPFIQYKIPKEIDMNIIMRRISELNQIIINEQGTQVSTKIDGTTRLKEIEQLPIGFYQDGIALKGFKFFPYGSKEAYKILLDLLDGYFPIQLKVKYPEGVYLKVLDRIEQIYENKGKDNKGIKNLDQIDEDELRPLGKTEFLNKFPKVVIKDGKIIEVRSEIEKKLKGNSNKADNINAGGIINVPTEWELKLKENALSDEEIKRTTQLKIIIQEKNLELIIALDSNQKITDLLKIISSYCDLTKFDLIQKFPYKKFINQNQSSLLDEGLFPNAALMMQSNLL